MQKAFSPLSIEQRENVRKDFRSNDNLFRVLYRPLHKFSIEKLTPEDVWYEGCLLVTRLAAIDNLDREIELSAIHDDLHERYTGVLHKEKEIERMILLVLYTVFLMLLDVHDTQEGHPHLQLVRMLKGYIIDLPGYNELFEECKLAEDQAEANDRPIPIMDYMADLSNKPQMPPVSKPKQTKPSRSTPQINKKHITFSANGINSGHITLLYQHMMDIGWIPRSTSADEFLRLFSGKSCVCKITWIGGGVGNLKFLFQQFINQELISYPKGYSYETILEAHFVDENGHYLTGLNSSKPSKKSLPIINECIRILQQSFDFDS